MYAETKRDSKMMKLISSYKSLLPSNKIKEEPRSRQKVRKKELPPFYSPRRGQSHDQCLNYSPTGSRENLYTSHERLSPRTLCIDDETNILSPRTTKLNRRRIRNNNQSIDNKLHSSKDGSLPDINQTKQTILLEPPEPRELSRLKERRNSISLPDLREITGCLVNSGDTTPAYDSSSDEDVFDPVYLEPKKHVNVHVSVRKCSSENMLMFPKIDQMGGSKKTIKRTKTEGCVFDRNKSRCSSRNLNISHLL